MITSIDPRQHKIDVYLTCKREVLIDELIIFHSLCWVKQMFLITFYDESDILRKQIIILMHKYSLFFIRIAQTKTFPSSEFFFCISYLVIGMMNYNYTCLYPFRFLWIEWRKLLFGRFARKENNKMKRHESNASYEIQKLW